MLQLSTNLQLIKHVAFINNFYESEGALLAWEAEVDVFPLLVSCLPVSRNVLQIAWLKILFVIHKKWSGVLLDLFYSTHSFVILSFPPCSPS